MKNIAIIIWGLSKGGAERIAGLLSKHLSKIYNVYLFLYDTNDIVYEYGGEIVDVGRDGVDYWEYYIDLYKLMYGIECSISFLEDSNILNIRTKGNDRVIVSERVTMSLFANPQYHNIYQKKKIFKQADAIVSVAEGVKHDLIHYFGAPAEKIRTIYNFIDQEGIRQKSCEPQADIEDFIRGSKLFVNIGRLEKQKNQKRLIKQFAALRAERDDIKLLIIGSGPLEAELSEMIIQIGISEDVRMIPYCENPFPYLRRADAYVMASHHEGLPNAVLEAMCLEIPVVAVDCFSGPRELLAGNANYEEKIEEYQLNERGILVVDVKTDDDGTTHCLKNAMTYILDHQDYAEHVKQNQRAYMKEYSNEKIFQQWVDVIENNIGNEKHTPFENELDSSKKLVIYGAGQFGKLALKQLQRKGMKIFSFAVTSCQGNPEQINEIPVRAINELVQYKEDITIIMGTYRGYYSQIVKQLQEMGFEDIHFLRFIPMEEQEDKNDERD